MKNLGELNESLFDVFEQVKSGNIDDKKAKSITDVANTIINNHKVQLQAVNLTSKLGTNVPTEIPKSISQKSVSNSFGVSKDEAPKNGYDISTEFAKSKGFNNVGEAISHYKSSALFNVEKAKWIESKSK